MTSLYLNYAMYNVLYYCSWGWYFFFQIYKNLTHIIQSLSCELHSLNISIQWYFLNIFLFEIHSVLFTTCEFLFICMCTSCTFPVESYDICFIVYFTDAIFILTDKELNYVLKQTLSICTLTSFLLIKYMCFTGKLDWQNLYVLIIILSCSVICILWWCNQYHLWENLRHVKCIFIIFCQNKLISIIFVTKWIDRNIKSKRKNILLIIYNLKWKETLA